MKGRRPAARDEHGVTMVLYALCMTVVLIFAALVIDLAQLRTDRRVNKGVADAAARSALGVLAAGPWPGICRASAYLRTNAGLPGFDAGSEQWYRMDSPSSPLATSPCTSPGTAPYVTPCASGEVSTWGKLTATADGGRYSIEIQSGYAMPDPRFAEDTGADSGDPCENLSVIVRQTEPPIFAGVMDGGDRTTTVRSVGRLVLTVTTSPTPALLLLEQHRCSVLTVNSNDSRVVAQPSGGQAGSIHIDTAGDQGNCSSNQAALNGKGTSNGPSILACSASATPTAGCDASTVEKPSQIGIYGLNLTPPPSVHLTSGPGSYGDTEAVAADQVGRVVVDELYRAAVEDLDSSAKAVLSGPRPPGCASVTGSSCTGTEGTWLVLQQPDCNSYGSFFAVAGRAAAPRIWFNCNLDVHAGALTLSAPSATAVITGALSVRSSFSMPEASRLYIGGRSGGDKVGLAVGNGGNLNLGNPTAGSSCPGTPTTRFAKVVVGNGSLNLGSGAAAHLCGVFVLLANGFDRVPDADGSAPCSNPCNSYLGTLSVSSGALIDWSAPNLVRDRRPTDAELATDTPFEDLALWTEAGTNASGVSGGATSSMTGVFFLGNADSFNLAGNGAFEVSLSAQFIARRMVVTGGGVVNLVPNPFDSVPVVTSGVALVR